MSSVDESVKTPKPPTQTEIVLKQPEIVEAESVVEPSLLTIMSHPDSFEAESVVEPLLWTVMSHPDILKAESVVDPLLLTVISHPDTFESERVVEQLPETVISNRDLFEAEIVVEQFIAVMSESNIFVQKESETNAQGQAEKELIEKHPSALSIEIQSVLSSLSSVSCRISNISTPRKSPVTHGKKRQNVKSYVQKEFELLEQKFTEYTINCRATIQTLQEKIKKLIADKHALLENLVSMRDNQKELIIKYREIFKDAMDVST